MSRAHFATARPPLVALVVLIATAGLACSQHGNHGDTTMAALKPDTAPGSVAVTTEVAPGILMTVDAGPGTGLVLADGSGRAVYVLDNTPADTNTWRPVSGATTPVTTDSSVKRSMIGTTTSSSGVKQATYNGKPLYYYSGDTSPKDRKGAGVKASGATGRLVSPEGRPR
jgi:predicted lipoprotein with Yx(FWY)xxD motif